MDTRILKLITAIIAVFFAVAATAQEKTHYISVMKKGVVDFRSNVSDVDSVVFNKPLYVTGISLDKTTHALYKNESYTFKATVTPDEKEIAAKTITWKSSNSSIAGVDQNGKITALTSGTTIITAQVEDKTATCSVTVYQGEYVIINKVKWATCNINAPGTFVSKPEDFGMYYQWENSGIGWSTTDPMISTNGKTSWINGDRDGSDPSPSGWRMPKSGELDSLDDLSRVNQTWTTENGVYGIKFTDKDSGSSIFLPAAGYRYYNTGSLSNVGRFGYYWSITSSDYSNAEYLFFSENDVVVGTNYKTYGFCIRPVAK